MRAVVVIALIGLAGFACTSGSPPPTCPTDLPASCPSPMPSYTNDVVPLIEKYCQIPGCHVPTGSGVDMLSPYQNLFNVRTTAETQIYECIMPLMPPRPSDEERVTLLSWFVCGAPNN